MKKGLLIICVVVASWCSIGHSESPIHPILKESATLVNLAPIEQRDGNYIKFLAASVKLSVNGASGSGTICYYDSLTNWAYVLSCGHLWSGNKSYVQSENKEKIKIITWYHNDKKLEKPKIYEGEILFWSNERGYDVSLVRFQPDWIPSYFPIAKNFKGSNGDFLNSMGCDGGREVARYEVEFLELRKIDLITERNSPRPGRSGGGLVTNEGKLVGICWGTSDVSGDGIGYFTPISSIQKVLLDNEHDWLLHISQDAQKIIIYDWQNHKNKYNEDFIVMPNFLLF